MATIHLRQTTTATPEQFVAGLTDFGPGRQELFGNSTDAKLKVGERLHYDWSDPKSSHTYTLTRQPDGTTEVDAVIVREGKNFKGRALGLVLSIFGKQVLGKTFADTLKAIEARNEGGGVAAPATPG